MLVLEHLSLRTGYNLLFHNLSLTILPNTTIYIYGENGIGKTSLLRAIAGIQKINSGAIYLNGQHINYLTKPYVNYLGHRLALTAELTVLENLKFWPQLYNSTLMLESAINYWQLEPLLSVPCFKLSAGNRKKVALARLLSCQSHLWLLDEPTNNLDEHNCFLLENLIRTRVNTGGIVIMTTTQKPSLNHSVIDLADFRSS